MCQLSSWDYSTIITAQVVTTRTPTSLLVPVSLTSLPCSISSSTAPMSATSERVFSISHVDSDTWISHPYNSVLS